MTFLKGPGQVSGWQVPAWEFRAMSTLWTMNLIFDMNATNRHSLCDMNGRVIGLPLDGQFCYFLHLFIAVWGSVFKN